MIFTMSPDERAECDWLHGLCHAHALACVAKHGGGFVVITDNEGTSQDDVLHVLSVHRTASGSVIRDAAGEALAHDLFDYVDELFPGRFGNASEASESDIRSLMSDGKLLPVSDQITGQAEDLDSVVTAPGEILRGDDPEP